MRKFVCTNAPGYKEYDAVNRRAVPDVDFTFTDKAATKPSTNKESIVKGTKPKSILAPRQPGFKNDSIYSQRSSENGSMQGGGSASNLFANLPPGENKVLTDLHNMIERQKAEKNPQLEILRAERDFYYSKLRDIDHILDVFTGNNVETLVNNIREILYLTPEKIAIVCEDGDIKIKNKAEEDEQKENEMNFLEVENGEGKVSVPPQKDPNDVMLIEEDVSIEEISRSMLGGVQGNLNMANVS